MRQVRLAEESLVSMSGKKKKHGLIKYVQNFKYN